MKILGWIFAGILIFIGLVVFGVIGKGCGTAERMADKTVFNADRHVWTYEEFFKEANQYKQYEQQIADAQAQLADLEKKGITSGQRYDNLSSELDGVRQMMRRIAANYNAMSQIGYQGIWKSRGLPERLGE